MLLQLSPLHQSQKLRKLPKSLLLPLNRRSHIIPRKVVISTSKPMSTKRISRRKKPMADTMLDQLKTLDMPKMMLSQHLLMARPSPRKSVELLSPLNLTIVTMVPESKTKKILPTSLPV